MDDRYKKIFEAAECGILVLDLQGHILDYNPAAVRMMGRSRGDLRNRFLGDFTDGFFARDLPKTLAHVQEVGQRYEDMVLEPQATLRKVCEFIGLSYSDDMLQYANMVDEKVPEDKRWLWPALNKPLQSSKCFQWKSKMDLKRRVVFEGEARAMLNQLGYETYTTQPKNLVAYIYELWCFLGRGQGTEKDP